MSSTVILIDDDKLIHQLWMMAYKKEGVDFYSFFSVDEFFSKKLKLEGLNYTIYIDQDLDKEGKIKGITEAKRLFESGYENIVLATGHDPKTIELPSYINSIQGKRPPV